MVDVVGNRLNFECPKGEAVFYNSTIYSVEIKKEEVVNTIKNYFQQVYELKDDRLLVLTADLLLENVVDNYLSAIMPLYKKNIADKRDFTFSMRIAIAKSLKLSPSKIFISTDLVRRVRNEFVHNLAIKSFKDLDSKFIIEMRRDVALFSSSVKDTTENLDDLFKNLAMYAYFGILNQIPNIRSLNTFLRSDDFLETFAKIVMTKAGDDFSHGEKL